MLVKLLPEQVAAYWDDIRVTIEESLPPVVGGQGDRMSNILTSIMAGEMNVWISVDREKGNVIDGVATTTFTFDQNSGTKALLLYTVFGYGNSTSKTWQEGLETLKKYAQAQKCHRILGYTDVEGIKEMARRLGGEARFTLVSFPLD